MVPTTATTCSIRFSRARTRAPCSLLRAPQPGHTPPRLTTRSLPHSGHSILVRSGIAVTNQDATSYRIRWQDQDIALAARRAYQLYRRYLIADERTTSQ